MVVGAHHELGPFTCIQHMLELSLLEAVRLWMTCQIFVVRFCEVRVILLLAVLADEILSAMASLCSAQSALLPR